MSPIPPNLPEDIVVAILEHVSRPTDLVQCATVHSAFHRFAIPFLYRSLTFPTVRTVGANPSVVLPQHRLLQTPEYAKYVRHVRQAGGIGIVEPGISEISLRALRLCGNLRSFSWVYAEDPPTNNRELSDVVDILQTLPIQRLLIHTSGGINAETWPKLTRFTGLKTLEVRSINMATPLFAGWSTNFRESLTNLELDSWLTRGVDLSLLSELRVLKHLRIRKIPDMLQVSSVLQALPSLESLDTLYIPTTLSAPSQPSMALLRHLTIETSDPFSFKVAHGPLWKWILQICPRCSLESLEMGPTSYIACPSDFLRSLSEIHGAVLRRFSLGPTRMAAADLALLCASCPRLEYVSCELNGTPDELDHAILGAHNLRGLNLKVYIYTVNHPERRFLDIETAKVWMLRPNSRLRTIQINQQVYVGQWVLSSDATIYFDVTCSEVHDTWD